MNCREFEREAGEWMEGIRGAEAREHVMACERCRALVEDLDAIRLAAPQLAAETAPPERLWASIRSEIEHESVVAEWMEGERGAEAREHVMACERCSALIEDLDAIRLAAPQLAGETAPPERLWASIRSEIEHESVVAEWMEGERGTEAREHVMACERCSALIEDLESIRLAAPQLAGDVAPPSRLWASVRAQLEREGLTRQPSWWQTVTGWLPAPSWGVAVTATAALALAFIALVQTGQRARRQAQSPAQISAADWLSTDQPELASVDTRLDNVERGTVGTFRTDDPAVSDTLEQNLAIINRQIALCEKSLEQAPADENTSDYLYDAYRQKAELLNMIAERSTSATE